MRDANLPEVMDDGYCYEKLYPRLRALFRDTDMPAIYAQIVKYVCRHRDRTPAEDLQDSERLLEHILEKKDTPVVHSPEVCLNLCADFLVRHSDVLSQRQFDVLKSIFIFLYAEHATWSCLEDAKELIHQMLESERVQKEEIK